MKRAIVLLGIAAVVAVSAAMWTSRAARNRAAEAPVPSATSPLVLPPGTLVQIKLVGGISEGSRAGETLQGLTTEPILVGTELAIPADTRVVAAITAIHDLNDEVAEVTLQLQELIFRDRNIPVHAGPVTTKMKPMSDFDLLSRAMGGMLGGAVGAARSAAAGRDPSVGAGAVGAESGGEETYNKNRLIFRTLEPIDLTGIAW